MSLAFQKLNGLGTTQYDQLLKLAELIDKVEELGFPEVYKLAKMFAPDMQLTPVTMQWNIGPQFHNSETYFDGVYFGQFIVNHNSFAVADSDNAYKRSIAKIWHGDTVKYSSVNGYHGDDILPIRPASHHYLGYATSVSLDQLGGGQPHHEVCLSFIGFKLAELPTFNSIIMNTSGTAVDYEVSPGVFHTINPGINYGILNTLGDTVKIYPHNPVRIDGVLRSYANPYVTVINSARTITVANAMSLNIDENDPFLVYLQVSIDGSPYEDASSINYYNERIKVRINPEVAGLVMDADWKLYGSDSEQVAQFQGEMVVESGTGLFDITAIMSFMEVQVNCTLKIISISTPPGAGLPRLLFRSNGSAPAQPETVGTSGSWVPALPVVAAGNARLYQGNLCLGVEYPGTGKINGVEYVFPAFNLTDVTTWVKVPIVLGDVYELTDFAYLLP